MEGIFFLNLRGGHQRVFTASYFVDRLEVELAGHWALGGAWFATEGAVHAVINSIEQRSMRRRHLNLRQVRRQEEILGR